MAPSRVGIFPVLDIDKDGKVDAILLQTRDTMMQARDKKGRKVMIAEQSVEYRPVLATETAGIYSVFHAQDSCKTDEDLAKIKAKTYKDEGIFWRYQDAGTPFSATAGGQAFRVGQEVYVGSDRKKALVIEAFRVGVQMKMGAFVLSPVEAMVKGCQAVALTALHPVTAAVKE